MSYIILIFVLQHTPAHIRVCLFNLQVATVYSPVLLEEEQKFWVAKEVQGLTNAESVKLNNVIDKSIIAGFVINYGSEQIDLSVRGKLEDVAQELVDEATAL